MGRFNSHNDGNGWMPIEKHIEGVQTCNRCGVPLLWVRTARKRIPFHRDSLAWRDHRGRACKDGWAARDMAERSAWITTKWRLSSRLRRALVRDGRKARPWKAPRRGRAGMSLWPVNPATQAGRQTIRRAAALGAPPPFLLSTRKLA